ncbi:MAG: hypothetical protein Q8Q54_01285 [Methylococcales bacterium]|nr:hypothetical protein [Methylococcales bacterium]MDP3837534.1 hypothetical protein [Methylococcales bacterium]
MKRLTVLFVFLLLASPVIFAKSFFGCDEHKGKETPVTGVVAEKMTATIKKLPDLGAQIKQVVLIDGIRAMDDEIASAGEIKILVDLDWQALAKHPEQRKALDDTAAAIITAVFADYNDITKMRVIIKTPTNGKYASAAKVFSFTRPTWELTKNNPRYHLDTPTGATNLLALGDYVVLTDKGWVRGY